MWDGLEGERDDHAGRRREARVPAAGAVREVVDGRESRHVFIVVAVSSYPPVLC